MGARVLVIDDSPTLRKVVGTILTRHDYQALTASDGQAGLELLDKEPVDLVLLDFVMPRMNGYQFCRELRARESLKTLPVVLMSAKAERIRDQFLRQTGALDANTKPFDPRGLLAVVEAALARARDGKVPEAPKPEEMPEDDALLMTPESLRPSSRPESRQRAKGELVQFIAGVVSSALKTLPADAKLEESSLNDSISEIVDDAALIELAAKLGNWRMQRTAETLSGDISGIPLGEILQVLQMQRQSGVLEVSRGKVEVTIVLRDGCIDLAQAKGAAPEFRLGRYLIDAGVLTKADLENAVEAASKSGSLLGDTLVQMGLVTEDDVRMALTRQTSEMIYDVLRWQRGRFVLLRDLMVPEADAARLGLPVAAIVMEGFRRVDEWRVIEESIHFEAVLVRNEPAIATLGPAELTAAERSVLDAVDGERTVREIIDETQQSSFDACKTFYRMLQSRLVRLKAET